MRFVFTFQLVISVVTLLFSSSLDLSHYPDEIRRIKERDTLIVAQFGGEREGFFAVDDLNRLPGKYHYEYDGHRIIGYDVELAKKIADELAVNLRINRSYRSFNDVSYAVARGEADMAISKLSVTPQRAQFLNFSKPYLSLRMALLINRMVESRVGVKKENELYACESENAAIGVLDNSSFVNHGKRVFPGAELKMYPDQNSLFEAVKSGEILAVLYEEYEIGKYMRKQPDLPIYCHMVELPGQSDDIAVAVAGKHVTLHAFVETLMRKESINPTVQYIIENFIPEEELTSAQGTVKINLLNPSSIIALILSVGLVSLWISLSRRHNKKGER